MTDVVTIIPHVPRNRHAAPELGPCLFDLERSISTALAIPGMSGVIVVAEHDVTDELADQVARRNAEGANGLVYRFTVEDLARVFVIHGGTHTIASAFNAAIGEVSEDVLICPLLPGEMFHPEIKSRQIDELLVFDGECSFSGHDALATGATWFASNLTWRRDLYLDNQFATSSTVYHRSVLEAVGGYDESLAQLEDWDFALRTQHAVGWASFPDVTCITSRPRSVNSIDRALAFLSRHEHDELRRVRGLAQRLRVHEAA